MIRTIIFVSLMVISVFVLTVTNTGYPKAGEQYRKSQRELRKSIHFQGNENRHLFDCQAELKM